MWNIGLIQIQAILHIHKNNRESMYPEVGLIEEEKKERKIENNNEVHHICVGTDSRKHTENC
jgi:hypothetical protein